MEPPEGNLPANPLPPLRDIIARHGLRARRKLGQHFLLDLNLTRRIVHAAGDLGGAQVIEIGPGPGGLTRALLESPASHIVAIEHDRRCLDALAELSAAYPGRLRIIAEDALTLDPATLCPAPRKLIANLPYNIATALLLGWSKTPAAYDSLTLMFQKEVAARLVATPGNKAYGRLSVLIRWLYEPVILFDIDPRAFTPAPKVTSTLIGLTPRPRPSYPAERAVLERLTGAAFGQRRKMLRSSLKTLGLNPLDPLEEAGISPEARGETLDVEQFCALARAYSARITTPADA